MRYERNSKGCYDLEILEDLDGVDLKDRIIEGVCDQMQDVNYTLLSVEIIY